MKRCRCCDAYHDNRGDDCQVCERMLEYGMENIELFAIPDFDKKMAHLHASLTLDLGIHIPPLYVMSFFKYLQRTGIQS